MAIVSIQKLSKSYWRDSHEIPVLRDISFEIPEGDFLGLMGPSGSGKTTLLNLIAGIDKPTAGRNEVAGTHIGTMNENAPAPCRARDIGFVFQVFNPFPLFSAP